MMNEAGRSRKLSGRQREQLVVAVFCSAAPMGDNGPNVALLRPDK